MSDNVELQAFLDDKVGSMGAFLHSICSDESRNAPQHNKLFETFHSVIQTNGRMDFMKAKDVVVQEVHAI
jgi:hypothetical protein